MDVFWAIITIWGILMKILVMGGTRFFGIRTVDGLVKNGHDVTVATRGNLPFPLEGKIKKVIFDHRDEESIRNAFSGDDYDIIIDKIAFSSNDVRRVVSNVSFDKYVLMSTCGVYNGRYHTDIKEEEFDPYSYGLIWGERDANGGSFDYDEGKRQAECAAARLLEPEKAVMVRFPVVMGENDYTKRLMFYIEHIAAETPMYVNNPNNKLSFLYENDAGDFFCKLAESELYGAVNLSSRDIITTGDIIKYAEEKLGKKAVIDINGDIAPYNGFETDATWNTDKAQGIGFVPLRHKDWIYDLIDSYIMKIKR